VLKCTLEGLRLSGELSVGTRSNKTFPSLNVIVDFEAKVVEIFREGYEAQKRVVEFRSIQDCRKMHPDPKAFASQ